jgi:hypothetical protein
MLSTTKLYVDSRYAVSSSGASIEYEIPGGIALKPSTKVWLSEFTCVASWRTVDASNDTLYIQEEDVHRVVQLPRGVYDLQSFTQTIESVLNNSNKLSTMGTYSVTLEGSGAAGGTFRIVRVSNPQGFFRLPNKAAIEARIGRPSYTTNGLLGFPTGHIPLSSHLSGFVDLRRVHSLFIHSPSFGAYNSLGPRGDRTIMAKIPCNVPYGALVTYFSSASPHDFIEAGVSGLTTLRLELRDAAGELLDLQGSHWSCTLLFDTV